jgi:hypothetical protein
MDMKCLMSTLARQIEAAKVHTGVETGGAGTEPRSPGAAILRSLRVTYSALSTGLDPWKDAHHLFLLNVSETGDHVLTQDGAGVPVNAPYLAYLFWSAGVDLVPGQFLFLEPEVAKIAIEEALGRVALEQAFAEREWVSRRTAMEVSTALPGREELEALRRLEAQASLHWDRKLELVAASLIADEFLERTMTTPSAIPEETEAA